MGITLSNIQTGLLNQSSSQVIDGSLKFNRDGSTRLEKTFSTSGSASQFTWSYWVKRTKFGLNQRTFSSASGNGSPGFIMRFNANEKLEARNYDGSNWSVQFVTTRVFRDVGWYHIVCAIDVSQSATTDRVKLYVNGERITAFDTTDYSPSQGAALNFNGAALSALGSQPGGGDLLDGGMTNFYAVDGLALGPENFGFTDPLTNTWRPKKYTGVFNAPGSGFGGTVWSSYVTNGSTGGTAPSKAFNGSIANNTGYSETNWTRSASNGNTPAVFDVSGVASMADVTEVKVYVYVADSQNNGTILAVNDVNQATSGLSGFQVFTVDVTGNGLDTIKYKYVSGSGPYCYLTGVTVSINGGAHQELIDGSGAAAGVNGFYLPMDGNSPIGQDKSGNGNDWTPVNFGGGRVADLDESTGGLPILNTIQGGTQAGVGVRTDAYSANLALALPLLGDKEDVSHLINGESTKKTITNNGVNISNADSNFYNGSFYWDGGTTDRLTVDYSSEFQFGTGDFCVEFWVNLSTSSGNQYFWDFNQNGGNFQYNGNVLSYSDGVVAGSGSLYSTGITLPIGKWVHLAVTREGSTGRIFVNGEMRATGTTDYNYNQTTVLDIGNGYNNSGYEITGYMQDFRIYKGVAKYTSDFVVTLTDPEVVLDTPSGVSGGSKLTKITDGAVSFDGSGDYLDVGSSSDYQFGTGDFTFEGYFYANNFTNRGTFIDGRDTDNTTGLTVGHEATSGQIRVYMSASDGSDIVVQSDNFVTNKWTHVAVSRDSGTVRLFVDGILQQSATRTSDLSNTNNHRLGYKHYSSSSFNYFNGFMSNVRILKGTALYTSSFTPPTEPLTNATNTKLLCCQSNVTSGAAAVSPKISGINDGTVWSSTVSGPTRKEDRVANAFNGSTSGPGAIPAYPGTLTFAPGFTGLTTVKIYGYYAGSGVTLHVNGSQQSPSSGAFTLTISTSTLDSVVWTATNGFNYMRIDAIEIDSTVLIDPVVGPDDSNEAATTFNPFNTSINTVRGQETSYCTMNPLDQKFTDNGSFSNGNLDYAQASTGARGARCTIGASSGKWYWEFDHLGGNASHGIQKASSDLGSYPGGSDADGISWFVGGNIYRNGSTSTYSGKTFAVGDCIGTALDLDNGTLVYYKNGVSQGVAASGLTGTWFPSFGSSNVSVVSVTSNFGQKPFKFPPPDGFQPLNAANVRPETVISRPDQFVGIVTYTGNDATSHSIKGLNFNAAPDFVWIKNRDQVEKNILHDTVRGVGNVLYTNSTQGSDTGSPYTDRYQSFDFNGFTVGTTHSGTNSDGDDFVAWCWKAGGSKGTFNIDDVGYASFAASGITAGTITPTGISAGTKQGFSIIKYDGAGTSTSDTPSTIPHGLSQAPSFFMVKAISGNNAADDWFCYHKDLGASKRIRLNLSNEADTQSNLWGNGTAPTSSVISINKGWYSANYTGHTHILYAWHDVPGLQKFGSYTGVNSASKFVELGFRPALVVIKFYDGTDVGSHAGWKVIDNQRNKFNPSGIAQKLEWNTERNENGGSTISTSEGKVDFLSNGFRILDNHSPFNTSGRSYIYMAWAEAPTFNLYGGQSNAR